ncbi:Mitogen-activated protein kinase kinase kinase mlk-1 [Balamuthia mandrillaris]
MNESQAVGGEAAPSEAPNTSDVSTPRRTPRMLSRLDAEGGGSLLFVSAPDLQSLQDNDARSTASSRHPSSPRKIRTPRSAPGEGGRSPAQQEELIAKLEEKIKRLRKKNSELKQELEKTKDELLRSYQHLSASLSNKKEKKGDPRPHRPSRDPMPTEKRRSTSKGGTPASSTSSSSSSAPRTKQHDRRKPRGSAKSSSAAVDGSTSRSRPRHHEASSEAGIKSVEEMSHEELKRFVEEDRKKRGRRKSTEVRREATSESELTEEQLKERMKSLERVIRKEILMVEALVRLVDFYKADPQAQKQYNKDLQVKEEEVEELNQRRAGYQKRLKRLRKVSEEKGRGSEGEHRVQERNNASRILKRDRLQLMDEVQLLEEQLTLQLKSEHGLEKLVQFYLRSDPDPKPQKVAQDELQALRAKIVQLREAKDEKLKRLIAINAELFPDRVTALYNFEATCDEELSLKAGQCLRLESTPNEEWWSGECEGERGLFPASYVSPPAAHQKPKKEEGEGIASAPSEDKGEAGAEILLASVVFDFEAAGPEELSLQVGQEVRLVEAKEGEEWWKGECEGKQGIFPASFVRMKSFTKGNAGEKEEEEEQEEEEEDDKDEAKEDGGGGYYAVALYDFAAETEDELPFKTGDVIKLVECEDLAAWWQGELNGKVGLFPSSYVEVKDDGDQVKHK